jgi:hypothetical protein
VMQARQRRGRSVRRPLGGNKATWRQAKFE